MANTWIIKDWAGNEVGTDTFDSYGQARDAIAELATIEADNNFKTGTQDHEELYEGLCGDLYAINIDENGKELPNTGQYYY